MSNRIQELQNQDGIECSEEDRRAVIDYVWKKYRRELTNFAKSFLGNIDDAYDEVQNTLKDALEQYDKYKKPAQSKNDAILPWIYTILKNKCRQILRKRKTAPRQENLEEHTEDLPDDAGSPDQMLLSREYQNEKTEILNREINKLPPYLQQAIETIRDFIKEHDEMPKNEELAELTNTTNENARQRKSRAFKILADCFKSEVDQ